MHQSTAKTEGKRTTQIMSTDYSKRSSITPTIFSGHLKNSNNYSNSNNNSFANSVNRD